MLIPWWVKAIAVALVIGLIAYKADEYGYNRADAKHAIANAEAAAKVTKDLADVNQKNAATVAERDAKIAKLEAEAIANTAKYNRLGKLYETLKGTYYADTSPLCGSWPYFFDGLRAIQASASDNTGQGNSGSADSTPR